MTCAQVTLAFHCAILVPLVLPTQSHAQTDPGAQSIEFLPSEAELEALALEAEGEAKAYLVRGEWLDAVNAFEKAYSIGTHPKYLLAIARIYDRMPDRCLWAQLAWGRFIRACEMEPDVQICDEAAEAVRRKVVLEAFCPKQRSHLAEFNASRGTAVAEGPAWNVSTTLGTGLLTSEWPMPRIVANTEVAVRYDSSVMGFNQPYGLAFEVAYWRAMEMPKTSIVRLGLSGIGDFTARGGIQAIVDPASYLSVYCGVGIRHEVTPYFRIISEITMAFWTVDPVLIPLEARLGVSLGF